MSPDGRWLLYESDETGRNKIYVRPFPNADDDKVTVSIGEGVMPRWSRRGGEIFYINAGRELVAASVSTEPRFRVTERKPLFTLPDETLFLPGEQCVLYDVAPDDQTFYFFFAAGTEAPELVLVQNWTEGLPSQ